MGVLLAAWNFARVILQNNRLRCVILLQFAGWEAFKDIAQIFRNSQVALNSKEVEILSLNLELQNFNAKFCGDFAGCLEILF